MIKRIVTAFSRGFCIEVIKSIKIAEDTKPGLCSGFLLDWRQLNNY